MSPVRAPLRSSSALVAVVVPWTITATSAAPAAAPARAACTPPAWLATVVGTLATRTAPVASSTQHQIGEGAADVDADELGPGHLE